MLTIIKLHNHISLIILSTTISICLLAINCFAEGNLREANSEYIFKNNQIILNHSAHIFSDSNNYQKGYGLFFPLELTTPTGKQSLSYNVVNVFKEQIKHNYKTASTNGRFTIYIMEESKADLAKGNHYYNTQVEINNAIVTNGDYDIFQWNAKNSRTKITIQKLISKIILPNLVNPQEIKAYGYSIGNGKINKSDVITEIKIEDNKPVVYYSSNNVPGSKQIVIYLAVPKGILKANNSAPTIGRTIKADGSVIMNTPNIGKTLKSDGTEVLDPKVGNTIKSDGSIISSNAKTGKTLKIDGSVVPQNIKTGKTIKIK